jgi:hypothetical protein
VVPVFKAGEAVLAQEVDPLLANGAAVGVGYPVLGTSHHWEYFDQFGFLFGPFADSRLVFVGCWSCEVSHVAHLSFGSASPAGVPDTVCCSSRRQFERESRTRPLRRARRDFSTEFIPSEVEGLEVTVHLSKLQGELR